MPAISKADQPKVQAKLRERGYNETKFNAHGEAFVESRTQRNQLMEVFGLYDRSAGFGDRAPQNR
jgi:hypothetical protein